MSNMEKELYKDSAAIAKLMMQGYAFRSTPLEELTRVTGKVAIVTGGTSGLGFCVAMRLLQGGANVVVSSFSEAEAETALPLLEQIGFGSDRVKFFRCDVCSESDVEAMVQFAVEHFGTLDILVNCAGVWSYAHIYDMPEEDFKRIVDVKLNGTFRCAKHASRYMVDHGVKGKMVFITSDCFVRPFLVFGGYPHYAAANGGVAGLTTELAAELKRYGILVNCVAPGSMATPGIKNAQNSCVKSLSDGKKDELLTERSIIMPDEMPDTDSVARAVYMMCTPLSDGITGETIWANRGFNHGAKSRQPAVREFPPRAE